MDFKNFIPGNSKNEPIVRKVQQSQLVSKEIMQSLIDEGLTTSQIGERLGLTARQITVFKNHRGMKTCRTSKLVLTDIEEQVVIGSILGDGCIEVNNKERGYYRLSIKHGEKQREYIWYKYSLLKRIAKEPTEVFRIDNREKFKDSIAISLRTTTNEVFKEYRERWYPNGIKVVNKEDLFKLSNLGLAIWIMDDGYATRDDTLMIATDCFDNESMSIILEYFSKNGIEVTLDKNNRIRIRKNSIENILQCIEEYFPESMKYKVRVKPEELLENLEIDNQQPSLDSNDRKVQRLVEFVTVPNDSLNRYFNGETTTSLGLF